MKIKLGKSEKFIVVMILILIGLAIAKEVTQRHFDKKLTRLKAQQVEMHFDRIERYLERYKTNHQAYPSSKQGLQALVFKPSPPPEGNPWKQIASDEDHVVDPWEYPYQYRPSVKMVRTDIKFCQQAKMDWMASRTTFTETEESNK